MEELLQQMKMALESNMSCEVETTADGLSMSIESDDGTKTYTVTVRED